MSPPPSTPTPRRFLLAKRATQSSQSATGPPQFQSTPRFGSSSVPRPTQRRREWDVDDVEDVEDRVEQSDIDSEVGSESESGLEKEDDGEDVVMRTVLNDSIEIESDDAMASQDDNLLAGSGNETESGARDSIERNTVEPSQPWDDI
ncbi:hypothetical protein G7046_g9460 [Stylonectria norvegica]|nr:hypothetical protein G7046_g9460 [Stylonectria norvegica]